MSRIQKMKRRLFLRQNGLALAALTTVPCIVPSSVLGKEGNTPANDRISMGFIGVGHQGGGHLFGGAWTYLSDGYLGRKDVQVVAVCDAWKNKRTYAKQRVNRYYSTRLGKGNFQSCEAYRDFRDLLARQDIDAVLIGTPIHWHATMAVFAARAGKDIYCEKPTAGCIRESQAAVKAVLENKCVFQAGTQQRSEYEGKFRRACEYIRSGRIGELKEIYAFRDGGGVQWRSDFGEEKPVPPGLDWDLWLGPAPKIPYQGRTDAHLFGFGGINWGQHHYDIIQWALDADRTGPVEIFIDQGHAAYRYANGVVVYGRPYPGTQISETGGAWFIGTEGRIGVDREHLVSEPASILEKPLSDSDVHLYHSNSHSGNFLECVKTRKKTICDVETAHHSISVELVGGIALQLKQHLQWNPQSEQFINNDEANKLLSLKKRKPWVV